MFVIVDASTNRTRVIEMEEFYRYAIEESFKVWLGGKAAKDLTDELIGELEYSDIHCIIVYNNDIYAINEKNRTFELLDKNEFENRIGCFYKSHITNKNSIRVLANANEKLRGFVFSEETWGGFKTTVLEEYPVISFSDRGTIFDAWERSIDGYVKNLSDNLKSGLSEREAKIVADEFCKKFISRSMITVETVGAETFFIKWKNGIQVVSSDDGKTDDAIKKFVMPYCRKYKKIVDETAKFLSILYFNK